MKMPPERIHSSPTILNFEETTLEASIKAAKNRYVVIKRKSKVVALLRELDDEQFELGMSDKFWKMMAKARRSPRVSLEVAEQLLGLRKSPPTKKPRKTTATKDKKAVAK